MPAQAPVYRDPRVDELYAQVEKAKQEQDQINTQRAEQQIALVENEEFFWDVKDIMADLMEVASRRRLPLDAKTAYNRAVGMHPDVSRVIEQRKAAAASNGSAQRSKLAASSVRSTPASGIANPYQPKEAIEERLKWGMPSFEYRGILGSMASFKAHASWGFWRQRELPDPHGIFQREGMFGGDKIATASQLPPQSVMIEYVRAAARLNEAGPARRAKKTTKPPVKVPDYLLRALRKNKQALATFEAFSPSHRREYVEWIAGAKQEATRERRITTAIEWLSQGKSHNSKYERRR